jgi:hypothetical protein
MEEREAWLCQDKLKYIPLNAEGLFAQHVTMAHRDLIF